MEEEGEEDQVQAEEEEIGKTHGREQGEEKGRTLCRRKSRVRLYCLQTHRSQSSASRTHSGRVHPQADALGRRVSLSSNLSDMPSWYPVCFFLSSPQSGPMRKPGTESQKGRGCAERQWLHRYHVEQVTREGTKRRSFGTMQLTSTLGVSHAVAAAAKLAALALQQSQKQQR